MSVGRRMFFSLALLIACTALLGISAVLGIGALERHYRAAEEQYTEQRSLYEIGFRVASVRMLLNSTASDADAISRQLLAASVEAEKLGALYCAADQHDLSTRAAKLRGAITQRLQQTPTPADTAEAPLLPLVNTWLREVAHLSTTAQDQIIHNRQLATTRLHATLWIVAAVFAATLILAVLIGVSLFRSVTRPVRALDDAVTAIAAGRLDHRLTLRADREFRRLMDQFNLMSATIQRLQNSMRQEVILKSEQLTRSEHLASVGCLAAGLAHEMNNPLGIITGYAQTCLRRLDEPAAESAPPQQAITHARETLKIVCEEAFRCSDVAGQLLQLAQPSQGQPRRIHMEAVARRAVELAQRLPAAKWCRLTYEPRGDPSELVCSGERSQLLQVLINVLTNALEACAPAPDGPPQAKGRVVLSVLRRMDTIIITVDDNGCGMTDETLARAFDPFFTDKARRGQSGSGLGLSLCHATIAQHRGRIHAGSDGPGRGSTLTIELPVATGDPADAQPEARRAGAI